MLKILVRTYATIVLLIAAWAWIIEFLMHQSDSEHLLPSMMLALATMPLSLAVAPFLESLPFIADSSFGSLIVLTLAAVLQAGGLVAVQYYSARKRELLPGDGNNTTTPPA